MLTYCMTKLYLVTEDHEPPDLRTIHDINLERIDLIINSFSDYEDSQDHYYFIYLDTITNLIKAKQMYIAWLYEEY